MPESRKRKIEKKEARPSSKYNFAETKFGKIMIVILCAAMVIGILFAAVYLMLLYLEVI